MPCQYTQQHADEFRQDGLTVLRGLIPPSLLADLRAETDKAREIARHKFGPQTQRLQPVYQYEELQHQPFRDFLRLPALRAAVEDLLTPTHRETDIMGVLLEPAELPWCTHWHRDWGYNVAPMNLDAFFEAAANPTMFSQLNAALYDDHSLWVVPRSQARRDTPEERAYFPSLPPPAPDLSGLTPSEREVACQEYARGMPGAVPVVLLAGDCAFYRASAWHLGNYVPYTKRATLHDGFYGDDDRAWQARVREWRETAQAAKG
jgi:hypothetical protein